MRKPRTFEVGEEVGGVVILECNVTPMLRDDWSYKVSYACCGRVGWIKHKPLLFRIRKKAQYCGDCARVATNKANAAAYVPARKERIYLQGWGYTL